MIAKFAFTTAAISVSVLMSGAAQAGPGGAGHGHHEETAYGKPGDPKKPARALSPSPCARWTAKWSSFPR
jgi:hypothetical protein